LVSPPPPSTGRLSSTLGAAIATSRGTSQQGSKCARRKSALESPLEPEACSLARSALWPKLSLSSSAVQRRPNRSAASVASHQSKCWSLATARSGTGSSSTEAPRVASCRPLAAAAPAEYGPCLLPWRASATRIKSCRCSLSTAWLTRRQLPALEAQPLARASKRRLTGRSSRPAPAGSVSPVRGTFGIFAARAYAACLRGSAQLNVRRHTSYPSRGPTA
jgi:hypothetical protein